MNLIVTVHQGAAPEWVVGNGHSGELARQREGHRVRADRQVDRVELFRGFSVSAGYNRNWTKNFAVADNLLVTPDDYDEFCITVPETW